MIKHVKTLAACLSALLLAGCAASPTPAPTTTRYHVAMIAKSTSTEFWSAVFAGAEAAATEYNMDLTITGSESEEDYSSQNDLIEKAVEEGAQAIIFSASDYQKNAAAIDAAADKGVCIVVVDSAGQLQAMFLPMSVPITTVPGRWPPSQRWKTLKVRCTSAWSTTTSTAPMHRSGRRASSTLLPPAAVPRLPPPSTAWPPRKRPRRNPDHAGPPP